MFAIFGAYEEFKICSTDNCPITAHVKIDEFFNKNFIMPTYFTLVFSIIVLEHILCPSYQAYFLNQ